MNPSSTSGGTPRPLTSTSQPSQPVQWGCALLALVAPVLMAYHTPPSMTFFNQILAVVGWGLLLSFLPVVPAAHSPVAPAWLQRGVLGMAAVWVLYGLASLGSWALWADLPIGLAWMHAGLCAAALMVFLAGWRQRGQATWDAVLDLFLWGLTIAGLVSWVIGALQAFHPQWTDGVWLAEPTMPGRAVGNLRQPNHLSTLLVWSTAAAAALGARRRLPVAAAAGLVALFIWGVVLTASRTGMLGMGFLLAWGLVDRRLPTLLRRTLMAAPLLYGFWWVVMYGYAHLNHDVTFAAEARLHDHSDISSSRFAIWANVLQLIAQHPWWGVGVGEFNVAWSLTPFPGRPVAFFDHTHNVLLQWAVELGLPLTAIMTVGCGLGLWPYVRAWWGVPSDRAASPDQGPLQGAIGACAVIVAISSLHSLLEYPLWYGHLLLPTAFAWGLGLAAVARLHGSQHPARPISRRDHLPALGGAALVLGGLWCTLDYMAAAEIYAPHEGAAPLADRIALSQKQPWWGYQADYAEVTVPDDDEPSPPPVLFRRTLHNLVDTRLMLAYARSLAEHGELDKARYVVERLKEFRNPAAKAFLAECQQPVPTGQEAPFQCSPPTRSYTWRELLPGR